MARVKPPPAVPIGVVASDGLLKLSISWQAAARATGYRVYRSTVKGQRGGLLGPTTVLSFVDATAVQGQIYWYGVTATNRSGESALSMQDAGSIATSLPPLPKPTAAAIYYLWFVPGLKP